MLREHRTSFEGIDVHCWRGGAGYPILLLHGSGPGASSEGNWRLVLDRLAERHHVVAMDLIGFGRSGRKPAEPYFDVELWLAQAGAMLDLIPGEEVGLVGQSLSGMLALRLAVGNRRIGKVLTTGTMGGRFRANEHLRRAWTLPETRDQLRRASETLVHDASIVTDSYLDQRMALLHADGYAPYFRSMFAGDKQHFVDQCVIEWRELERIAAEVVMIHGRDDLPVPIEPSSAAMGKVIPRADVLTLANCGHSPALEHPAKFLAVAEMLFG